MKSLPYLLTFALLSTAATAVAQEDYDPFADDSGDPFADESDPFTDYGKEPTVREDETMFEDEAAEQETSTETSGSNAAKSTSAPAQSSAEPVKESPAPALAGVIAAFGAALFVARRKS